MTMKRKTLLGGTLALAFLGMAGSFADNVNAADHVEAPGAVADPAADITDFFAWAEGDSVYMAVAFAGLSEAGAAATYDPDVLYGFHIDNDDDQVSDQDIWVRFGQNPDGEWGVQVVGLPGDGPIVGPVDENVQGELGQQVFAGSRDDAFFFDLDGFQDTLMTGVISFDADNDSFAGTNTTAIVIEGSLDALSSGGGSFSIWATTGRE